MEQTSLLAIVVLAVFTLGYWGIMVMPSEDSALTKQIIDLNNSNIACQSDVNKIGSDFITCTNKETTNSLKINDLNNQNILLLSQKETLSTQNTALTAQISTLQTTISTQTAQISLKDANIFSLQGYFNSCLTDKNKIDFNYSAAKQDLNYCKFDLNRNVYDVNAFFLDFNVLDFNAAKIKINSMRADYNSVTTTNLQLQTDKNSLNLKLLQIDGNISARFVAADSNSDLLKALIIDLNMITRR